MKAQVRVCFRRCSNTESSLPFAENTVDEFTNVRLPAVRYGGPPAGSRVFARECGSESRAAGEALPREAVPLPRGLRPLSGRSWYRPRTEQRKRRTLRGRVRLDHRWWRHGESNSGPRQLPDRHLQAQSLVWIRTRCAQRHARGVLTGSVLARAIPITCAGAFPLDDVAPGQGTSRG